MLGFAILTVFIAGLMVGRTPEYLCKKIEPFEMKMAVLVCLATPVAILVGSGIATLLPSTHDSLNNPGAHGLSEVLYAYSSAGGNNGSAFAGFNANTPFLNVSIGLIMLFVRFLPMFATLAIAGSLAAKKKVAVSSGTLPTHNAMFIFLLIFVVLLVGALSFFPALSLGPVAEFFQMIAIGRSMRQNEQKKSIFSNHEIMCRALKDSFIKLNPRTQIKNPVMFMVFVSAILTFVMFLFSLAGIRDAAPGYILAISVILWFTVLFGNFAEAIAEGRGKAQADALRAGRKDTMASRIPSADRKSEAVRVKSTELKKGTLSILRQGNRYRQTATWWKAPRRWMRAPLPASQLL